MSTTVVTTESVPTIFLSTLLRHAVIDAKNQQIGALADAIVRLRGDEYPLLTGLVAQVGSNRVFVPISKVIAMDSDRIELRTARLDLRPFERRSGEVLLSGDVLGHRLIDVDRAALVRAFDVGLTKGAAGWIVSGLDVHRARWFRRPGTHERHALRDWNSFEALIGHEPSGVVRSAFGRFRSLKPAQIADLIEEASTKEQDDLLGHLHSDPELEADVFEELEDNSQTQLLKTRSVEEVAGMLARMRTDDAADAILDLPQDRRQLVLDLLPEPQHSDVMRLMGYNTSSAGGLMGIEYLALSEHSTIQQALDVVREATIQQPEALTTIYSVDSTDRLVGALNIVRALQLDPGSFLRDVTDPDPVHAAPQDDVVDVTTRMADFNLLTLPVLDDQGRILGVVTVDDALDAAIPEDWRRRDHQQHTATTAERSRSESH